MLRAGRRFHTLSRNVAKKETKRTEWSEAQVAVQSMFVAQKPTLAVYAATIAG